MALFNSSNLYLPNRNLLRASNADHLICSFTAVTSPNNVATAAAINPQSIVVSQPNNYPDHFVLGGNAGTGNIGFTADAPTLAQCGFSPKYCYEIKCTLANNSFIASNYLFFGTAIDQVDASILSNDYFTYSLWAKTNASMTFTLRFAWNGTTQQMMSVPFTTNNTAAWQRYTFTIATPNAIAGSSVSNTGLSIKLYLMAMANAQTSSDNAWITYDSTKGASTTQSNFFSSTSNYLRLCLMQLEKGRIATPFEYRTRAQEIDLLAPWVEFTDRSASTFVASQTGTTTMRVPIVFNSRKIAIPTMNFEDTIGPNAASLTWVSTANAQTNRATTSQSITRTGCYAQQTAALNYKAIGHWRADARANLFNF